MFPITQAAGRLARGPRASCRECHGGEGPAHRGRRKAVRCVCGLGRRVISQIADISGDPIRVPADAAGRTVLFFISSRTRMMVKRPAVGAEGFVLDHYDRAAIDNHLNFVGEKLLGALAKTPPYAVFSDSLEVERSDWTPNFLAEFQKRRGYDLTPYLPALAVDIGPEDRRYPPRLGPDAHRTGQRKLPDADPRMGQRAWHAVPLADLRHAAGESIEQRAGGSARRRRLAMAAGFVRALGFFGEPSLRASGDFVGNMDMAAFARLPRHAARHEGRGGHAFSRRHQSVDRPRLALFAAASRRAGMAILCGRRVQRSQSRGGW